MPQERLSMRKTREILRLKWEAGLSHRAIARSCSVSPGTVGDYIHRAEAAGLSWPLPADLDEEALYRRLFPKARPAWYHSGKPPVPLRWVLVRDPQSEYETIALLSTDPDLCPVQIVTWFVLRWQVEVT